VRVTVPEGSLLAAAYPAAVGACLEPVGRIIDLVFGALAQAIPDRVPAAFFSTTGVVTMSGTHPRSGSSYVGVFPYPGGYGATRATDGLVHAKSPQSMANFRSLELSEHRFPIRYRSFALREDSGGAGWHRGGCGSTDAIEPLASTIVSVLGDRADTAPFGVVGGGPAKPSVVEFTTVGRTWRPAMRGKEEKRVLEAGDSIRVASPGGGGWGDPLVHDLGAVEQDLNLCYVSETSAREAYGAVIAERRLVGGRPRYRIDVAASEARRAERRGGAVRPGRQKEMT